MALALVSVIAVAALAAAALLLRSRNALQGRLTSAQAESGQLGDRLATTTRERDELRDEVARLTAEHASAAGEAERQTARADELAVLLDAATARTPSSPDDAEAGLWHLLLTHITRRWAAVVGVPPDGRTIAEGAWADQLAQALGRETERLREEVGVDVELKAPPPATSGASGDVDGRVAVLVSALELLGALAASAQRVTVEVGESLVLTGDGWVDPYNELAAVYDRAIAAGVTLDPLEAADERVRLVLHPGGA